jgi:membrane carboxypeptidase/penicillin-binding protein PbpC
VWVGNDDGTPMRGVMGGGLPALLFRQVAGALER